MSYLIGSYIDHFRHPTKKVIHSGPLNQNDCRITKVRRILDVMIDSKTHHLQQTQHYNQQRWLASLKHWVLMKLPLDGWDHVRDVQSGPYEILDGKWPRVCARNHTHETNSYNRKFNDAGE